MDSLHLSRLHYEARRNANWILFYGVITIILALPSVFILVGLISVWLGVLLVQAANAVKHEGEAGLLKFISKIGLYFKITAIVSLIGLVLAVLVTIAVVVYGTVYGTEIFA